MDVKNILILNQVKGIGPAFFKKNRGRLMESNDVRSFITEVTPEAIENIASFKENAESILNICEQLGVLIVDCFSKDYPQMLLEINDPPPILYMKGNVDLLKRVIAIIGSRKSTSLGNSIAERLGEYFSKDFAICNGLVEGIDEHSIYVGGKILNKVIGVISGGLNYEHTCSKKHAKIINDVLEAGGLIVSEYPPLQTEDRFSGSKASRIQAGLSDGLILVQSKIDGGSKYTLSTFAKLPRVLGVIHFPASDEYQADAFDANRLIIEEQFLGIAKFIGHTTSKNISIKSIVSIQSKQEYEVFKNNVLKQKQLKNTLF